MKLPQTPATNVLLTGAGFTHNFGAPLAEGMWSLIFNHSSITSNKRLQSLLRDNFDFEDAFHKVMSGNYSEEERSLINTVILEAYESIDKVVREWTFRSGAPYPVNIYKAQALIASFAGENRECGFFFTLNQDLFIERQYYNGPPPNLPGIRRPRDVTWFLPHFRQPVDKTSYCTLPGPDEVDQIAESGLQASKFCYVKLHGSHGWQSHDGSPKLVIGGGKEELISREPLLRWYFSLFEAVLNQPRRKLLVIGYGFRDLHVNQIIANAVKKHGLRLLILNPVSPAESQKYILVQEYGKEIWQGLEGYFPHSLIQLYPGDQSDTEAARNLRKALID